MLHTSEISNRTTEHYPLDLKHEGHPELLQLRGGWISRGHGIEGYGGEAMQVVEMVVPTTTTESCTVK